MQRLELPPFGITHGSLFSGIGGFDLGFERAGIETVWQVEIEDYCRRVLARHFPKAKRYDDVRTVGSHNLEPVDIISGGFPCQDVSQAQTCNERTGTDGQRSGLWTEMRRIVGELRPSIVVVENVSALLERGIGRVLGDLAELGYDAEWESLPASAFGAPHIRERIFILAYPAGVRFVFREGQGSQCPSAISQGNNGNAAERSEDWKLTPMVQGIRAGADADWWRAQSSVVRSVDGIPDWMERIRACGNGVVPQIAEWIGRRIVNAEQRKTA